MKNFTKVICILLLGAVSSCTCKNEVVVEECGSAKEYYEWRYYTINEGCEADLDKYLADVLIPAYERQGVKTGAFELAIDSLPEDKQAAFASEPAKRIVLFVYKDLPMYEGVKKSVWEDAKFRADAQPFFDSFATNPPYSNLESFLCEAFDNFPALEMPAEGETLLEIRTYWSPNEEANKRKVDMFNTDEMVVFEQSGIHDLCYGEVIAGPRMPALIYLTSYQGVDHKAQVWGNFGKNDLWNEIKSLPKYKNTATNNKSEVVVSMPYSKI